MIGITGGTTRAHIVRATEEAIAYQVADLATAMEKDAQVPLVLIRCDGGAVQDRFLMQFQADILNLPLELPSCTEATALGTAFAAAIGAGYAKLEDAKHLFSPQTRYTPEMDSPKRQELLYGWHKALERAKGWYEEK